MKLASAPQSAIRLASAASLPDDALNTNEWGFRRVNDKQPLFQPPLFLVVLSAAFSGAAILSQCYRPGFLAR